MIIGDFTGILYTVIAILAVLLVCYGTALLVSFRVSHPRQAAKGAQPRFTVDAPKAA